MHVKEKTYNLTVTISIILPIDINISSCNTLNTDINDTLHKAKKNRLIESI